MRHILFLLAIITVGCKSSTNIDSKKLQSDSDSLNPVSSIHSDTITNTSSKRIKEGLNYFKSLKFPVNSLDSLVEKTFRSDECLPFTSTDDSIFNNNRTDISYKYISIQDTTEFLNILVYRQMDMENCVFLYSFDKNLNMIDSVIIFCCGGGSVDPNKNVLINGMIVNMLDEERKAYFRNGLITSSDKEMYSFEDKSTNSKYIKVGRQNIVSYKQDKTGHFKKVHEDSFTKDFADFKNWY